MAAVPSIGRASRVEHPAPSGADAATDLYERYSGQIFGYCLHQLGSREEAEDAVQTTFMNAFRGLSRGIVPEAESAWLFKIAHNVCLSRRRSSWRRGRVEAPNNLELIQEVVPARERTGDELISLQDVLETMPENQRRAILLREWQGLSYREIADELQLSQSAVETLIFRARRTLAEGLERNGEQMGWRSRVRRGTDLGGLLVGLQAFFGGSAAAVKVAATVVVATTAVVATSSDQYRSPQPLRVPQTYVGKASSRTAAHAKAPARLSESPGAVFQSSADVGRRPAAKLTAVAQWPTVRPGQTKGAVAASPTQQAAAQTSASAPTATIVQQSPTASPAAKPSEPNRPEDRQDAVTQPSAPKPVVPVSEEEKTKPDGSTDTAEPGDSSDGERSTQGPVPVAVQGPIVTVPQVTIGQPSPVVIDGDGDSPASLSDTGWKQD